MTKIRLLLLEDNRILREGIMSLLKREKDITVAALGRAQDTVLSLHRWKPNVILMDLGLRSRHSLRAVEAIRKEFPAAKVIVMDLAPLHGDIMQYVRAGASGIILKEASPDDFLTTIRAVAQGEKIVPPVAASLFSRIVEQAILEGKGSVKRAVRMTKRERQVLELLADGRTNKDIAQNLRVSTHTVKSHVRNIMEKLALHTRLEVANYASTGGALHLLAEGIMTPDR